MIHLQGRTAFVTGSSRGVGRAIVLALAEAGADVVVHGRSADDDDSVVGECRALGRRADFVTGDLAGATDECVDGLYAAATDANPDIDLLVNNAGTYDDVPFLEMDAARFERTWRLNVAAPFFLTQRFARRWTENGVAGRVLMIGSINGRMAEPVHSGYDTSKGAVDAMVRTLCVELAPLGIRINGLAPGLVRTPLTAPAIDDPRFRRWMELHTPNGSVPDPDVCGGAAVYLLSDAARHVTGQMLLVDGGMSAWQQPDMPDEWV